MLKAKSSLSNLSKKVLTFHTLYNTYNALQMLLFDILSKNKENFLFHLKEMLPSTVSDEFKIAMSTLH